MRRVNDMNEIELREVLMAAVESGKIIAFLDGKDIRYKHIEHCDDNEIAARISIEDLRLMLAASDN